MGRSYTPPSKRVGDKAEISPTSRAKCIGCGQKIMKGIRRIGKESYDSRYNRYIHRYYHEGCMSTAMKKNLRFGISSAAGTSLEQEFAKVQASKEGQQRLLGERHELREFLRDVRREFARRLDCKPYMIFHDTTLNELVVKLPKNKRELLDISGIGPKKYKSFGGPILQAIAMFAPRYCQSTSAGAPATASTATNNRLETKPRLTSTQAAAATAASSRVAVNHSGLEAVESDDDSPVEMGESLSCEEIVRRKFQDAEENGYMIELDG